MLQTQYRFHVNCKYHGPIVHVYWVFSKTTAVDRPGSTVVPLVVLAANHDQRSEEIECCNHTSNAEVHGCITGRRVMASWRDSAASEDEAAGAANDGGGEPCARAA